MHQPASPQQPQQPWQPAPPVPAYARQPHGAVGPGGAGWGGPPRQTRWAALWGNKALRATGLVVLLALSGLVILALVREQTGTKGFLVGLGLATLPVPLLLAAFRWAGRVEPKPWRNLAFAFAWGACAATLVALIANGFATQWLTTTIVESSPDDEADADAWGATFVAPVVEESAKAAAVLLLFLFRRRDFNGIVDGVVVAGVTATGFAFTENILYLGTAFVSDQEFGYSGLRSTTAATFFIRAVMSPFAHPLFTAMTGVGFGLAAVATQRQRARRILIPIAALLAAMVLHGVWNGSATFGGYGFLAVYALFMVPLFGLLTWLTIWSRGNELGAVGAQLTTYQAAGWLTPPEPPALSSMRARGIARDLARRSRGPAAARTVGEYIAYATSLALLRQRAHRGLADPDFSARERELLQQLWQRREVAQPALAHAALSVRPPRPPRPPMPQPMPMPFAQAMPPATPGPYGQPHTQPMPTPHAETQASAPAPHRQPPYGPWSAQPYGPYGPYGAPGQPPQSHL
ncbi:PrsW family intramembrane metalloprotease [Streptomyces sp. SAJ15]|uniref:PrsW family intramembrane metalloprotease n=1 Tax=Streptomyces sp. SAJ15 TaxID=2011095 RepID=UPI001184CB60|nr:PrsW family intramembrane metalloprotease [Streptomyces sp. SAJ15]